MGLANNYEPNVMGGGSGFGGFGHDNGLGIIALLALLGRRGGGILGGDGGGCGEGDAIAAKVVALQNSSDLRDEICEVGSSIQSALQAQTNAQTVQFNSVREGVAAAATEALRANLESRIASLQSTNELSNLIRSEGCQTRELTQVQTQAILNQLAADKLDEKNDEIANLRRERDGISQQLLFSNQFNAMNSVIANLAQEQRATQQSFQFGTGLVNGQSSNTNQVRT